jgi:hypothetical protein
MNLSMGKNLYEVYKAVSSTELGVGMDAWDDLDDWAKQAWDLTARLVGAELSDEAHQLLRGEPWSTESSNNLRG